MRRLQLDLSLEFRDRLVRLLLQEEDAVRVVHVLRLRIAGGERLERLSRGSRVPCGHHVAGAARHQDHLAPIRRRLVRQHRHAKRRDAHRFDHARIVVALAGKLAERLERLFVLLGPRHQHGRVIAGDAREILCVADAEDARLQQELQRAVVLLQTELAQAEERIRSTVLGRQPQHLAKGVAA